MAQATMEEAQITPNSAMNAEREQEAKRLLDVYKKESHANYHSKVGDVPSGQAMMNADPHLQIAIAITVLQKYGYDWKLEALLFSLFARNLPWSEDDLVTLLQAAREKRGVSHFNAALRPLQRFMKASGGLTPPLESELRTMLKEVETLEYADARKFKTKLSELLGESNTALPTAGETWADRAIADIAVLPESEQNAWKTLFGSTLR